MSRKKLCRGSGVSGRMRLHDDGNAWMCSLCGWVVKRTRTNPYPDTTPTDAKAAPGMEGT